MLRDTALIFALCSVRRPTKCRPRKPFAPVTKTLSPLKFSTIHRSSSYTPAYTRAAAPLWTKTIAIAGPILLLAFVTTAI